MGFFDNLFGKKSEDDVKREEIQKRSLQELASGGIPVLARERIEREVALGRQFFSSDLTVREFSMTRNMGLKIIGQVMGTSFYNTSYLGMSRGRWRSTGEMVQLTEARLEARRKAINRLKLEAQLLGADGVIGVRFQSGAREWSSRLTEFTAFGTAVKIPGWTGSEPFTSHLSVQDFWQLHNSGYAPIGIAMGACSYYMYTDANTQNMLYSFWFGNAMNNQEIDLYTRGFQYTREQSMRRLEADVAQHQGDGVIGVNVSYDMEDIEYEINDRTYHDYIAHFVIMGTIVKHSPRPESQVRSPLMVLDLASGGGQRQWRSLSSAGVGTMDLEDDFIDDGEE